MWIQGSEFAAKDSKGNGLSKQDSAKKNIYQQKKLSKKRLKETPKKNKTEQKTHQQTKLSPKVIVCTIQYAVKNYKSYIFIPIPKKVNAKECSNCHIITLISQVSKVVLKILQARLQQNMNYELPDIQAGFRKGRGTRGHC